MIDALVLDSTKMGFVIYPVNRDVYNGGYIEKLEQLKTRLVRDDPGLMEQIEALGWDKQLWRYEKEKRAGDTFNDLGYICCYKKMQRLNKILAITEMHISMSKVLGSIKGSFPEGSHILYKPDERSDLMIVQNVGTASDGPDWNVVSDAANLTVGDDYPNDMKLNYSPGMLTTDIVNPTAIPDSERHASEDDLGMMEDKFYDMLEKIRVHYVSMLEHENEKKTFELELLQSRINPHFLYNTLSTMKWNCKNEKMADIIDSMVHYYRLALNKGDTIIKISHEMMLVAEYLKIQKYTYKSDVPKI